MITHNEARDLASKALLYGLEEGEHDKLINYIAHQEKKDELLNLYKNFQYHVYSGNVGPRDRLNEKILKLEKELEG